VEVSAPVTIAAMYRFVPLPDHAELREPLLAVCRERGIFGSILLAAEGINGTISGPAEGVQAVLDWLGQDPRFAGLDPRLTYADYAPFDRMKVRLKAEIITLRDASADPLQQVGADVEPEDWNALIERPDVLLIDTRNREEVALGSFAGAIDPQLGSFSEFTAYAEANLDPDKHRAVAMFCTGGIRCEKASSYLLARGFSAVYQLRGGILHYLQQVPEEQSLWEGECFVFDQRRSLDHDLAPHFSDKDTARDSM
jgi:UPF0176 protein